MRLTVIWTLFLSLYREAVMAAYVIGDIKITDPDTYAKYAARVPATSEPYGVRYLVRGPDKCEIVEGDWLPERLVLAEYESLETIKAWYYSPEYSELIKLRQSASTANMIFVEGEKSGINMAAYLIGDIEITDQDSYEKYRAGVPATVAAYGGKFLVRGAQCEVIEGAWTPHRLEVLGFESMEKVKAWYNSAEYSDLKKIRQSASKGNLIFAEGA